ncbi:class II fructose-bisphosphate aldolase [Streptococcus halichoeri]|uniref:class II fructose-bisphosphate aldolase n=1 Tax=Streptococcus halichoeri TaxID=254785 RepID=UPI0013582CAE|nr:class II fructose-bisphosphate aldolase [Streptococcus halichoeri]
MVKVSSKEILEDAMTGSYAIPHANFIDWNSARAYVREAEKEELPLILAFAQSHSHIINLEEAACIGNFFANHSTVPIVLHLDHGKDFEFIQKAIELGFSSVMIDASQEAFEDNIAITQKVVDFAHNQGVVVEAELGHVGSNSKTESNHITDSVYTEVSDVIEFVERTNVDSLAISIGTAHGIYKGEPKINFQRLHAIKEGTSVPLVLHGGSSSGTENLSRCAKEGISKINIYTDFMMAALKASHSEKFNDYIKQKDSSEIAMADVLNEYYKVFGTRR